MNATDRQLDDLLAELDRLDVRLTPTGDGGLTIDAPEGALTSDLIARLRTGKPDLLARLTSVPESHAAERIGEVDDGADDPSDDADAVCPNEAEAVDPVDWNGCVTCGSLDAWLPCAGDRFGRTPGRWRCSNCDPPEASRRMREVAERIRADEARRSRVSRPRGSP